MQYCLVNACINTGNNASTLCENLVNIGPVSSEFRKAEIEIFEHLCQNSKYLTTFCQIFTKFSVVCTEIDACYKTDIHYRVTLC